MSSPAPRARDAPALLERAVGYTRASLQLVPGVDLRAATPCAGWDLRALLEHLGDSLDAFTEAAEIGYVDLVPPTGADPGAAIVERLKGRACALLGAWAQRTEPASVALADRRLEADVLAAAGALEVAVHGWDVARACGADRPLPEALALELLDVLPWLLRDADRPGRFADRNDVPLQATPGDRLLAALGRRSGSSRPPGC